MGAFNHRHRHLLLTMRTAHIRHAASAFSASLRTTRVVCAARVRRYHIAARHFRYAESCTDSGLHSTCCSIRPKPVGSGFFAWLFPPVPLVPEVPSDVSNAGRSPATDAQLFPSDEQLSQRTLWVALLIAIGWSILALGGALPLYLVNTPCNSQYPSPSTWGGGYSTLQDLSLLRLLKLVDNGEITADNVQTALAARAFDDDSYHTRIRIIVLVAITILLGLIPPLIKIVREFNVVVAHRKRWLEVQCQGKDLGWLSAKKAPGFATWGEKQFKDYLVKIGLSSQLGDAARRNGTSRRNGQTRRDRRAEEEQPLNNEEEMNSEVDIQTLFSITCVSPFLWTLYLTDTPTAIPRTLPFSLTSVMRSWNTSKSPKRNTSAASE